MADDAGALLVRSGLVSASALDEARARVAGHGGTLGEALVAAGQLDDGTLTTFFQERLLVPRANPALLARLPASVVQLVPADMAIELRIVPVSLDPDNNLTVAMSDPSNRHAVDEIGFFTGAYVVRAVATQMQIAWCLAHYYGHVTELAERLLKPDPTTGLPPRIPRTTTPPRPRSITDQVRAARHRRMMPGELAAATARLMDDPAPVPGTGLTDDDATPAGGIRARSTSDDDATPAGGLRAPSTSDDAATPPDGTRRARGIAPRARTASGEIKVPSPRALTERAPLPDDSGPIVLVEPEPSAPIITIEADPRDSQPVITIEADPRDSQPVITIEVAPPAADDITAPKRPAPRRKRPAKPDPPELAARAGEVQLATGAPIKAIDFDEPSIMISEELTRALRPSIAGELRASERRDGRTTPPSLRASLDHGAASVVVSKEIVDERSEPVLLERRRASDPPADLQAAIPPAEITDEPSDVIVLEQLKKHKRPDRATVAGMGPAITPRSHNDTVPGTLDQEVTDAQRVVEDTTRVDATVAPPGDDDDTSSDEQLAAPPAPDAGRDTQPLLVIPATASPPGPSGRIALDDVQRARHADDGEEGAGDDSEEVGKPTIVMSAVELDAVIPDRTADVLPGHLTRRGPARADDGWGPPGTTIPPTLLGAIPGALDETSGVIPLPDIDTAPLIVAPPSPPMAGARPHTPSESSVARALEEATNRVLDLIHTLDHTTDRDQVLAVMIAHLAESHQRAGFFAIRNHELSLFAITPRVAIMPIATLRLDRPSTLADVVNTRLPYRGPMHDEASRVFLLAVLGVCPPELLLVPVAVRERVVGVLFGDHRMRHTFDEQLALASRAAGMALERILKSRHG